MNRNELLDLYFLEARAKVVDLSAFLDRLHRAEGEADHRLPALQGALKHLDAADGHCAERVLLALSDPSTEPVPAAPSKPVCGAWAKSP
jgi:hypothetical protein